MASATERIAAIRVLETVSGRSVPAPAMAGAEMLIPRAAPLTERTILRPIPPAAPTMGSTIYPRYPTCWFSVGRERQPAAFIKLAEPFNPVKPQSLHENDQALDNHH